MSTDAAGVMAGNKGPQALHRRSAAEAVCAHCEPLVSEVMDKIDRNCKLHKDSSIQKQTWSRIVEEMTHTH
jgi:hypothetical protein